MNNNNFNDNNNFNLNNNNLNNINNNNLNNVNNNNLNSINNNNLSNVNNNNLNNINNNNLNNINNNNLNDINNNNLNNNFNFSIKLQSLIYLSYISQKKLLEQNNSIIRVVLLNKKWLYQYHYDKISFLINQANIQLNPTNINDIISKLNINVLSQIDQNLSNITQINSSFLAEYEIYQLKDKPIKVYKEFILVKYDDFITFIKKFTGDENININFIEPIGYINKKKEDLIFFVEKYEQRINKYLIIGKIDEFNNIYNLEFILDYNSGNILKEQKDIITNTDLFTYFNNQIFFKFNDVNNEDLMSPIIYNNSIIGNCYKCLPNMNNYSQCRDYTELINNKIFNYSNQLYLNYKKLDSNLNNNNENFQTEEYFLVNKSFISQIKQILNFNELLSFLNNGGVFNNSPYDIFNAIKLFKNTDMNKLKDFFGKNINNFENYYSLLDIKIIAVKYYDNSLEKSLLIYDDFELIDKQTIELFVDINKISNYLIECIINEGKIMILYPDSFDQEKRGISVIGKLINDFTFKTEYILVYENSQIREAHTKNIYGKINTMISKFQFVNHCQPIHTNKYKIVGTVIDYAQYDNTKNFNTPAQSDISFSPNSNINNFIQNNNNNLNDNNINNINNNINNTNNNFNPNTNIPFIPIDTELNGNIQDIRTKYIYPTLIGLENIGATCYMNATLQCFCHIDKFVNFFKYNKQANEIYQNNLTNTLSYSFKILIEQLWPNNTNNTQKYYSPYEFKNKISQMNPIFEGVQANDSKDLVNFIIMTLHSELNRVNTNTNNKINLNINLDQRNKDLVFNHFMMDFMETNKSIISDLFYGVNFSITQCQNCFTRSYNYQTFFFLTFPLEEVRKFKLQYNPNFNDLVNIYDCFLYNQKNDFMIGENSMYCNYCKQTCGSSMISYLSVTPNVLILILNRGKGIEFKVKINFFEELNLENFVEHKELGFKYKLIGVITHLGGSDMSGHFIAYCKDPISNDWYLFNDATVSPIQNFQNDVINYAMPYLLFYQKI